MAKDGEKEGSSRKEDEKPSFPKADPISTTLTTIKWVARIVAEIFK
jgi:hypothetical protein